MATAMPNTWMNVIRHQTDLLMAVAVVGILAIMLLPLPPVIIDLLLTINISLSVIILLTTIYVNRPLDFSVFPSVLLITTLFRLSLNISTTRVILLHGSEGSSSAGEVIQAFGQFVVGGNMAVGIVVFIILVIVNFMVITKGAGRVAEVAARFTLDKMPGKQMAIDADLNAGLINENEARSRRKAIEREAEFFGAMDGASKFVRGDAIAGILITLINIIGGFIIGVVQSGLSAGQSAEIYTILSVGDGLVAQVPALIISTAAGLLTTRAEGDKGMGEQVGQQLTQEPRVIMVSAGILGLFALLPGMPKMSFFLISVLMAAAAYHFTKQRKEQDRQQRIREEESRAKAEAEVEEPIEKYLALDPLRLEVGYALIPLVDEGQQGDLLDKIRAVRRQFASDMGFIVPPIHISDNLQLKPGEYAFYVKGVEVGHGELRPGNYLAMEGGSLTGKIEGVATTEPAFGLPALWISAGDRGRAEMLGYTVVDTATVLATHLTELIQQHAHEILSRQDVQSLIERVGKDQPKLIEELIPAVMNIGGIQKVLQGLLRERVSIRDLRTILETLADYGHMIKQPAQLIELVRQALSRGIVRRYVDDQGRLPVLVLAADAENMLAESIIDGDYGSYISMPPRSGNLFLTKLRESVERISTQVMQPVIVTGSRVRPYVKQVTEGILPHLVVLSQNEIPGNVRVQSLGTVSLS